MASIGARVAHGALRVLNLEAFVQAKLAEGVCALQHVRVVQGGQAGSSRTHRHNEASHGGSLAEIMGGTRST